MSERADHPLLACLLACLMETRHLGAEKQEWDGWFKRNRASSPKFCFRAMSPSRGFPMSGSGRVVPSRSRAGRPPEGGRVPQITQSTSAAGQMGGWADVILLALAASCPYSEHDIAATSGSGNTLMTTNSPRDAPSITRLPRVQDVSHKISYNSTIFCLRDGVDLRRATKETTTVFHVSLSLPPPIPSSKLLWPMKRAVAPAYHVNSASQQDACLARCRKEVTEAECQLVHSPA